MDVELRRKYMRKNVLLIGGRSKAKSLAYSLEKRGFNVTAVNDNYDDCMMLAENDGIRVVCGDGTKPFILDEVGAYNYDIAICLTPNDEDNLVACELCKKQFHVRKTVALVSDPKKMDFFKQMGVDSVVCAISTITNIIEQQAFIDEMANIIPIGKGQVQIVEVQIPEASPVNGKKLWEITLPKEVIIGCILREEATIIPRGETRILSGDTVVVISGNGQQFEAIKVLTGR